MIFSVGATMQRLLSLWCVFQYLIGQKVALGEIVGPQTTFQQKIAELKSFLLRDFTGFWSYKDLFGTPGAIGATPHLIQKSIANLGDEVRLRKLIANGMKGEKVWMPIIGGSISRGAPFSEKGLGNRIYFNAVSSWWNFLFKGISGSTLESKNIALGGVGSDYFSYCLDPHLNQQFSPELIIWELSANDKGRYKDKPFPTGHPLEQLTRNILTRFSRPALIFINFFRGADISQGYCNNYEDEGGLDVAIHYKVTSLSWRNYVCDYIKQSSSRFGKLELFSSDQFHPSILGHAQMAFIMINYLRNAFLRALKGPAGNSQSLDQFIRILDFEFYNFPSAVLYEETSKEKPLCFTYLRHNLYEPNNTLFAHVTRQDNFRYNIFKQFQVRGDKLCGMKTDVAEQLLQFMFLLPRAFSRLVLVSHADSGSAQVWVDNQTPVCISTDDYHMGTLTEIVSTNLRAGKHILNALSLKNGFVVSAIAVI